MSIELDFAVICYGWRGPGSIAVVAVVAAVAVVAVIAAVAFGKWACG